jgi:hypothetical protein
VAQETISVIAIASAFILSQERQTRRVTQRDAERASSPSCWRTSQTRR